jgi:hypothetical protein
MHELTRTRKRMQARMEPVHYLPYDPCDCGPDRVRDVGTRAARAPVSQPALPVVGAGAAALPPADAAEVFAASLPTAGYFRLPATRAPLLDKGG